MNQNLDAEAPQYDFAPNQTAGGRFRASDVGLLRAPYTLPGSTPSTSAYAQPGLAPTGLALRRVLGNLLLGTRNRSKILPKSIGLLIVFVS